MPLPLRGVEDAAEGREEEDDSRKEASKRSSYASSLSYKKPCSPLEDDEDGVAAPEPDGDDCQDWMALDVSDERKEEEDGEEAEEAEAI
jgi:hypothetical protein